MARKILLADDSVTAQNMGRRILTDAGYEVITVNNGSAAIKKIAEIKPDIVMLDVYMPGYGGLEICQRIRETRELARIPILLTVGKLEPFRAEDSVRVRADAFVIKPFETSELLTALTKLEDKIVPSAQSFSGGRFARAVAAVETSMSNGREFGDADTGWKSRLKIPAPYSKPHHSEAPPAGVVSDVSPAAKTTVTETGNVASILPEETGASLPHDVTAEEIAAITKAAAMLAEHSQGISEAAQEKGIPAALEPNLAESASAEGEPSGSSAGAVSDAETSSQNAEVAANKVAEPEAAAVANPVGETGTSNRSSGDDEVTAALDALTPSIKSGTEVLGGHEPQASTNENLPATMAAVGAANGGFAAPRWVAEEVPVRAEESALVLELEMHRTYAAFAAADAARSVVGENHKSPIDAVAPAEHHPAVERPAVASAEAVLVNPLMGSYQTPAASIVEAQPELARPLVESIPAAESPAEEKAAYAVASASSSAPGSPSAEAVVPKPEALEPSTTASEAAARPHDGELAAAWANWKQVRETAGNQDSKSTTAAVSSVPSEARDDESEPAHTAVTEVSEEAGEDAIEIANIVDSVLADLKPKLMKEISQKMAKGKGKRKK